MSPATLFDIEALERARIRAGLTAKELSRRAGISNRTYSKILTRRSMAPETLVAIADALGIGTEVIVPDPGGAPASNGAAQQDWPGRASIPAQPDLSAREKSDSDIGNAVVAQEPVPTKQTEQSASPQTNPAQSA